MVEKMLEGCEVRLNTDYFEQKQELDAIADKVIFTGRIDRYFDFCYGELEYRSLNFEHELLDKEQFQSVAVVNYTDSENKFTRIIEHKHFEGTKSPKTIITREYPAEFKEGMEPYYPVNDEKNSELLAKYLELSKKEKKVIFGGRLGSYKYYDMDDTVKAALDLAKNIL